MSNQMMYFVTGILLLIFLMASNIMTECYFGRIEMYWKRTKGIRCTNMTVQNLSHEIYNITKHKELRLQITNINFASFSFLDMEFSKKIRSIQVLNNTAKTDLNTFSNLTSCKYIELYENNIGKILKGFNNTGLVRLRVENSEVEVINDICLRSNATLEYLSFPGNKINMISKNFSNCIALQFLDLSNNHIDNIEENAFIGLDRLRIILLNQNRLTNISLNIFSNIIKLYRLDIQGNLIKTIDSNAFYRQKNMYELRLDHNSLKIIKNNTFNGLNYLGYIDLTNAEIVSIEPGAFNAFTGLYYLYIFSNPITDLPSGSFVGLSRITSINLSKTNLKLLKLNQFFGLNSIKYISIYNSKIQTIEKGSLNLVPELKHFDISFNVLDMIPCDMSNISLQKMTYLDISNNKIKNFKDCTFKNLPSLVEIDLNDNLINNLVKATFSHLKYLEVLNIANNRLKCLDYDFISSLYQHLKSVKFITNRFDCIQNETLQQLDERNIIWTEKNNYSFTYNSNAIILKEDNKEKMIPVTWFIVTIVILLVVIILTFIFLFWYRRKYLLILEAHEICDQEMDEFVFGHNNASQYNKENLPNTSSIDQIMEVNDIYGAIK